MYHIFTARKLILTSKINNINMQLMQAQFKRDDVSDTLLDSYKEYYGIDAEDDATQEGHTQNGLREEAGIESADTEDESDDAMLYKMQEAKEEESQLDAYIKRLETELTAAQKELESVEQEESNAINRSVPNYSGVEGNGRR